MSQDIGVTRKLKHSIEHLTSPNSDGENASDGGPSSPKKLKPPPPEKESHPEKIVSYTEMIAKAIFASSNSMATLADIYSYLIVKYPILKGRGKSWKNSVRHTLSLNEWFIKIPKLENAKCCYWSIHPIYIQRFKRGDFQKQRKASSATKLRAHHTNRYFDFGYDISPTLDYHFLPPPPHFQEMNPSALSPNTASAFSPWPIPRAAIEDFPPNFLPPHMSPQYPPPYAMYSNAPTTSAYTPYYPSEHDPSSYYRQDPTTHHPEMYQHPHPPHSSMKHSQEAIHHPTMYEHHPSSIKHLHEGELNMAYHHKEYNPIPPVAERQSVKLEPHA